LGIEASVPVWRIDSLNRDASSGGVLLTSSAWTRADAVRVVVELEDNPAAHEVDEQPHDDEKGTA
jgi:GntR family phosphonate transport system transcriptional regulator